ncbi:hypothetical protein HQR03_07510 [Psychrobacter okhotskensis]|uniref:hypothetical protein n=1 Tax=Psychrobacter okhotskensis TaxID=212403 RepID=UPI00156686B8|nr:hypothetical protein [Psychrobacter okhotskensis]NRD70382.1 hypothetical protein [Psychrobacter okhotskensis]
MSIEKSKELQERIVITIFENAPENWDKYCPAYGIGCICTGQFHHAQTQQFSVN